VSDPRHRLDWVVLLPSSARLPFADALVLGGDDELGSALVAGGVAVAWRRPSGASDRAGLVVARDDCSMDLEAIARHVAQGGTLYMEVDRRRPGHRTRTPHRVDEALRRGGCHTFSIHIAAPDLDRVRRYLPIEHTGALRWYLRVLFIPGSPLARAGAAALSALLSTPISPAALRWAAPRYIVIATTSQDDSPASGVPLAQGGERAIVVTSGYDQASRAVVLPFARDSDSPRFAVKIASSPSTAVGTKREHERLVALHAALAPHIARGIPEPLCTYTLAGRTACVQSCAPGPLMNATVGRWRRPLAERCRDLDVVVDWLTEFASATAVDRASALCDWTGIYGDAAAIAGERSRDVTALLAESERVAGASSLANLAVHQHYDAAPWNVHLDGTRAVLIDWETDDLRPADCLGPPLADVVYLATYWYFLVSGAGSDDAEVGALLHLFATPKTVEPAVLAARAVIDRSARRLGIERRAVPAALVAMWAERAIYTHRRREALGAPLDAGRSRPEAYLQALAGVSRPLFGTWAEG